MAIRYKHYNQTLEWIEAEEEKGNLFVIRPSDSLSVDRIEKNPRKLDALYKQGYKAVSYTHLDVYKRQHKNISLINL